jgi:hypothetical protein
MSDATAAGRPSDEQVRAARGVFARHRRRRHPDRARCGFCGGVWRLAPTTSGRLVEGCAARHLVADVLARADQFDQAGNLVPPPAPGRPANAAPPRRPVPPSAAGPPDTDPTRAPVAPPDPGTGWGTPRRPVPPPSGDLRGWA